MLRKLMPKVAGLSPLSALIWGYLIIMVSGALLLSIPFFHQDEVLLIDTVFSAISAVSTTGLITVSTPDSYNFAGELLLLLLVQVGGLGYMSILSLVVLWGKGSLSPGNVELIKSDYSLPRRMGVVNFVRSIAIFSFALEAVGALFLYYFFRREGVEGAAWQAIFHSVSAFCTSGLTLFNDSLQGFARSPGVSLTISFLSIAGSMGFIVFTDLYEYLLGKREGLTFTTRIILRFTLSIILLGTVLLFFFERQFSIYTAEEQLLLSFFQSMTSLTTVGFSTFPTGELSAEILFILVLLMLSGASPSGTGGGIKSTTITSLYAVMMAVLRERRKITFAGNAIPIPKVRLAVANFFFYLLVFSAGTFFLLLLDPQDPFPLVFEACSALGTVGLTTGITSELTLWGKIIIILLMFMGRVGPITLGWAVMRTGEYWQSEEGEEEDEAETEDIAI